MKKYRAPSKEFFRLPNKIFDVPITPIQFTIYAYLVCCAGSKGYRWPSIKTISDRTGISKTSVNEHLKVLAKRQIIEIGKQKRPGSNDSHEYQDYIENPTRGNADMFIGSILELHDDAPRRNIYLKYISERPGVEKAGTNGLFTDEGVPIVLSQVQEEMNNHPGNIWTHIISLRREDAERLGYNTPDAWMHLLRSQRNMIAQHMKIAPENFRWYAAFHNAGHHPHVHMMAYSINPNEPYLTEKGIENIKSSLAKEIFQQDLLQIYQKQTDFRDKLRHESKDQMERIVAEINAGNFADPVLEQMLLLLSKKLSLSKGKKQYGYLKPEVKKLVDEIVAHLSGEEHIRELYDHWYNLREDVLRTYTDTFPDRLPLERNKEFKSIRNAVVQHALQIQLPLEDVHRFDLPSSESVQPPVDFPDDGSKVYTKAVKFLRDPTVPPTPQMERFYHEAAIRGSVDAVYGMGKLYTENDISKAIGFFELAASQGNTYAEYQLGKIYCFGLGVPRDLDKGIEWLRVSTNHGNTHATSLLRHVQEHIHVATVRGVFGLLQSIVRMIQGDGNHLYQKRQGIDRKQRQKIIEKKMRFEIDKHRVSIRLTAPYSERRKAIYKKHAKENGLSAIL